MKAKQQDPEPKYGLKDESGGESPEVSGEFVLKIVFPKYLTITERNALILEEVSEIPFPIDVTSATIGQNSGWKADYHFDDEKILHADYVKIHYKRLEGIADMDPVQAAIQASKLANEYADMVKRLRLDIRNRLLDELIAQCEQPPHAVNVQYLKSLKR